MLLLAGSVGAAGYCCNVIDSFVPDVTLQNQKCCCMLQKRGFLSFFARFVKVDGCCCFLDFRMCENIMPLPRGGKGALKQ